MLKLGLLSRPEIPRIDTEDTGLPDRTENYEDCEFYFQGKIYICSKEGFFLYFPE